MGWASLQFTVNPVKLLPFIASALGKGVRYVAGLGKSSNDVLSAEVNRLKAIRRDILLLRQSQSSTNYEMDQWLDDAKGLIDEVKRFRRSRIHGVAFLGDLPFWATDLLQRVQQLNERGAGFSSKGRLV